MDDDGPVGANGRAMLRARELVVEIDVQQGAAAPDPAALDHLRAVLTSVVANPDGVRIVVDETFLSDRRSWTVDDLRTTSATVRDTHSTGDALAVHVLYLQGSFSADGGETNALGVAYTASTAALFPDRWRDLTTVLLGGDVAAERAVLVHELGHLFGLVDLTYRSEIDHEDPEHPGHSRNRGSVMYWAIETTLIGQLFEGPPPDDFDAADRADLDGLRSGRL